MKWRPSSDVTLPSPGFIEPCLPTVAKRPPARHDWIYELKYPSDFHRVQPSPIFQSDMLCVQSAQDALVMQLR